MDIWIVNPFDDLPGGNVKPGRYMTLAATMAQRGHNVLWWSSDFDHRTKRKRMDVSSGDPRIVVVRLKTPPYGKNISIGRLYNHFVYAREFYRQAVKRVSSGEVPAPDRIIVSMPPLLSARKALALGKKFNSKVVIDVQDAWPETFYRVVPGSGVVHCFLAWLAFAPLRWLAQSNYAGADAVTAVARYYLSLSRAEKRNIPSHLTYIGAPVAELRVLMNSCVRTEKRFTFVYLGSISANYDLETVIRAASDLKKQGYSLCIKIAGSGSDEEKLKHLTEKLELMDTIEFCGFLGFQDMAELLRSADVALNVINPESICAIPNKVGDYFAAGLPVINSIDGELSDLLSEYKAGLSYSAGDAVSLARNMRLFLDDPSLGKELGRDSGALGQTLFDREISYVLWAEFLEGVSSRNLG